MKKYKFLVIVIMLGSLFVFASTLIDLAHQVKGVLPLANGGSGLVGSSILSAQTASLGPTTLFTVGAATSSYVISGSLYCKTAVSTATVGLTVSYTDPSNTAQTITAATSACSTLGASSFTVVASPMRAKNATAITYSTTVANSPNYDVSLFVYQTSSN